MKRFNKAFAKITEWGAKNIKMMNTLIFILIFLSQTITVIVMKTPWQFVWIMISLWLSGIYAASRVLAKYNNKLEEGYEINCSLFSLKTLGPAILNAVFLSFAAVESDNMLISFIFITMSTSVIMYGVARACLKTVKLTKEEEPEENE